MTKEELKQEAIKYAVDYPTSYGKGYKRKDLRIAYLAGAEPREKRIEELKKENKKIFNDWLEACDKYGKVNLEQQKNKKQLEQAKELLRRCYENYIYLEPLRSEIKQFLNGDCCPDTLCEDCTKDCPIEKIKEIEK